MPSFEAPRARESLRVLSLLNRYEYERAQQDLGDNFTADLGRLLELPVGRAYSFQAGEQLIKSTSATDWILHFFGHGRDGGLYLGDRDMINVYKFNLLLDRLTARDPVHGARRYSLVFLNACETAIGDSDHSLRSAAARPGICGLVATEALVPRKFAIRFSIEFLKSMIDQGYSVSETMDALRHRADLWPETLLYGCYASPEYRIAPASGPPMVSLVDS
jgi:hypothetical protein